MNTLGERIKYLRKSSNTSQDTLSRETGISRSNISKIESNGIDPSANAVMAIARFFRVSSDWLLTGENPGLENAVGGQQYVNENRRVYSDTDSYRYKAHELLDRLDDETVKKIVEFMEFELYKQTGRLNE